MAFQDWSIPENGSLALQWRKGTALPTPINFNVNVRDILGEPEAAGYHTLEYVIAPFGVVPWLSISGDALPGIYNLITTTGIQLNLSCNLNAAAANLNAGPTFTSFGIFIYGRDDTFTRKIISFTSILINAEIFHANQPIAFPSNLIFNHQHQSLAPDYQLMTISAIGSWNLPLTIKSFIDVEIISGDIILQETVVFGSEYLTLIGNGSGTFKIKPSQSYLDTLAISVTAYTIGLGTWGNSFGANANWYYQNIFLSINVVQPIEVVCNPSNLFFQAIKTVYEAPLQLIEITSEYNFSLILPSWAIASTYSGVVGINNIEISVALSSILDADTYTDNIIVEYDNGNGMQQFLIPITYLLQGFVVLPYSTEEFNFTLDNKMVSFYTDLENTFFEILMNVRAYNFYLETFQSFIVPLKIPLLRGKQNENIGLKIHRLMKNFEELNISSVLQYKTCEVFLEVKEKDLDTLEIKREFTLENIKFIAGITPILSNGMGILNINNHPIRVTKKSKQFLNLLIKNGSRKIEIFKNDILQTTYFVNALDFNIYKDTLDFESLECIEGDIIEYKLFTDIIGLNFISKKYYVFPESNTQTQIIWEDEYKLQSTYDLLGEYTLKTDLDFKTFKKYKNTVEVLENIQTTKEVKLSINTGYILKTDQITIDSICRSRKAWIIINNTVLEAIPQTKSLINIDSDRELNSFDLEFIINKKTNEEIYSF